MAPSPTFRRLFRETLELSSSPNPNPTFHAAPVSDSNLHEWHFTLLGPPSPSPYAGGLYHGRITLPSTYPLKPPNFRFLTPSGRFEVNREICLSISGFHEETWMPAWGIRTALTALRSFMAEKGSAGQVGGMEANREVRERLARESKDWRCESCGSRTNKEIMWEWWVLCKEHGVKVEEEMSLEDLPEGLRLEVRDPESKAEDCQPRKETEPEPPQAVSSTAAGEQAVDSRLLSLTNQPLPSPHPLALAGPSTQDSLPEHHVQANYPAPPASNPIAARSAPPAASNTFSTPRAPQALLSQHDNSPGLEPQGRSRPASSTSPSIVDPPAPTLTAPPVAPQDVHADNNADMLATGTVDKAIGALFVALLIMILKKIFYPASGGGGGMEGSYMRGD